MFYALPIGICWWNFPKTTNQVNTFLLLSIRYVDIKDYFVRVEWLSRKLRFIRLSRFSHFAVINQMLGNLKQKIPIGKVLNLISYFIVLKMWLNFLMKLLINKSFSKNSQKFMFSMILLAKWTYEIIILVKL